MATRANALPRPPKTPCTTAKVAAIPRALSPKARKEAPSPAMPITVEAKLRTRLPLRSTHCEVALIAEVIWPIKGCRLMDSCEASAFIAPSEADASRRNEPPSPASICLAVSAATSSTSFNFASIASKSPMFPVNESPANAPRKSKISSAKESRSAVGIWRITTATSRRISASDRKSPVAVTVAMPHSAKVAWTSLLANCEKLLRKAVPASDPLMPILAKTPKAAQVSSRLSLAALA